MQRNSLPAVLLLAWLAPATLFGAQPSVRGEVLWPDGAPAAGVRVELHRQTSAYEFTQLLLEGRHRPDPMATAITSADGSYELEAPEEGMWHLYVAEPGYRPMEFNFWPLLADRNVSNLTLVAEQSVTVRVADSAGTPIVGVHVRASSAPAGDRPSARREYWRAAYRQAITDGQGLARIGRGTDESINVWAWAPGRLEAEQVGVTASNVRLELEPGETRPIKVQAPDGRPLGSVVVRLGERRWPIGKTDDAGLLDLPTPEGGELKLHALAADGHRFQDRLDLGEWPEEGPRVIQLVPLATYSGQLVDRDTRRPVAGGFAWVGGRPASFVRSDSTGSYSVTAESARSNVWIWGAAPGFLNEATQADSRAAAGPTLSLQPSVDLQGIVVDELDQPVADVLVTPSVDRSSRGGMTNWRAGAWLTPSTTDVAGRFSISSVHPRAGYLAEVSKPGFASAEVKLPTPSDSNGSEIRIVLQLGRSLIGRAIDQNGLPVAGARIDLTRAPPTNDMRTYLIRRALGEEKTVHSYADETGAFALHDLGTGLFDLKASAAGFAPTELPAFEVDAVTTESDIGDVVLEPGFEIEGRITNASGSPLEGAQVLAMPSPESSGLFMMAGIDEEEPVTTSDTNGYFKIVDRRSGEKLDLSFELSGYARTELPGVAVPTTAPVAVQMERAATLRGEVVDPSGRPIEGARVSVQITINRGMISSSRSTAGSRTNADGQFVIEDVDPGEIEVQAQAQGYGRASIASLKVEPGQELDGLRIEMQTGATISGRITGPGGRAVVGAQVMIMESSSGFSPSFVGGTQSGGDGRYSIDGVPEGSRSLTIMHDEYRQAVRDVEVTQGEVVLDIVLDRGVSISGRVVDESGAGVGEATLSLSANTFNMFGNSGGTTDKTGAFEIAGLSEATYTAQVLKEGFASTTVDSIEVGPAGVSGIEIRLTRGGSIVGQLFGLEPADYANTQIYAVKPPRTFATGLVKRDGSYRIDDVEPGEYNVQAQVQTSGLQSDGQVSLSGAGEEVVLDLEFGGGLTLSGTVLRSGEPLRGGQISLVGVDVGASVSGMTDSDGRFDLKGLDPGNYQLLVQNRSSGLHHQEEVDLQSDREIAVRLESARISGYVRDADTYEPLDNTSVRLDSVEPVAGPFAFMAMSNVTTDSAGFFKFSEAAAGNYRLLAERSGYGAETVDLTVIGSSDQEGLEIQLSRTEGVRIYVTLAGGERALSFMVSVLDAASNLLTSGMHTSSEDGGTELSLGPGSWQLRVATIGTAVATVQVEVPGEPVAVQLQPEALLKVRVSALEGEPTRAKVSLFDAAGQPHRGFMWMQTNNEWPLVKGRAQINGLSAGTWTVRVEAPDGRIWESHVQLAPGENPELVLG